MRDVARKGLERLGFSPKVDGIVASVTLSNGVKLSTSIAPCFDAFSFLVLSIKKFYPSELTEGIYFYSPVKVKRLDDKPPELMGDKVQFVDDSNIDFLLEQHYATLIVENVYA